MAEALMDGTHALESTTVGIYRTATVIKGGRRFSFGALVVVGDRKGSVGIGYGKAPGVPSAIEKAQKDARKKLTRITLQEGTLPHSINCRFGASMVRLVPAAPGTGVIAGATVRAVLELAGVRDCLTKVYGSSNQKNLCKATYEGLTRLRNKEQIESVRGVSLDATEVEKRLDAGRRYAPTAVASAETTPRPVAAGHRGRPGAMRGKSGGRRKQVVAAAAPPPTEASAETPAGAPPVVPEPATEAKPEPGESKETGA